MSDAMAPNRDRAEDLYKRAVVALYRTEQAPSTPVEALSGVEDHDGKVYVVLRNASGVIACYRVRNDYKLKRLVRLPSGVDESRAEAPAPQLPPRCLTDEELARVVPDDFGTPMFPPHYPAEQRAAFVRETRDGLKAMCFAPDADPVPAARKLVQAWHGGHMIWNEPPDSPAWIKAQQRISRAMRGISELRYGRKAAARTSPRSTAPRANARLTPTAPDRRPRSRDRRDRGSGRVTRPAAGDSGDGEPPGSCFVELVAAAAVASTGLP